MISYRLRKLPLRARNICSQKAESLRGIIVVTAEYLFLGNIFSSAFYEDIQHHAISVFFITFLETTKLPFPLRFRFFFNLSIENINKSEMELGGKKRN